MNFDSIWCNMLINITLAVGCVTLRRNSYRSQNKDFSLSSSKAAFSITLGSSLADPPTASRAPSLRRHCPKKALAGKSGRKFNILVAFVRVLDSVSCPYNLHGGTLLNFVRDCEMKDSDIDVAIPLEWRQRHEERLHKALVSGGFRKLRAFGTLWHFGYEVPYILNQTKIDTFSFVDEKQQYVTGLWKDGNVYPCAARRIGVGTEQWGELSVRVPIPYETALESWYGQNWMIPHKGSPWRWFEDAFEIGSCRKDVNVTRLYDSAD